jgi:protein phosphatase
MGLFCSGITDIGMTRKSNQDSIYLNPDIPLFVVADGMGGHNGGDIASALTVKHLPKFFLENISKFKPDELQRKAISYVNKTIKRHGEADPKLVGMGTTVVSLFFSGAHLYLANIGDSRTYLVNRSQLFQLTRDHSLVQEKLNLGLYNREQAAADPQKNVLVRTVGFEDEVEVDLFTYKVQKNDIFISCSDGLHSKVSDHDIQSIVNTIIPDPSSVIQEQVDAAVRYLVELANKNGGNDNISVIIVIAQ